MKRFLLILAGLGVAASLTVVFGIYFAVMPKLPSVDNLKEVQFQVPLRIYTRDHKLLAEFGEKRRAPLDYDEIPDRLIKAVLAAEDDRFFEHPGVDWRGLLRAAAYLARTGEKGQGGSTITMQVARNFFLSREKTYLRKLNEIFLALKIEDELSKEEIITLYLNKIYFGHRAYGVAAAARVYYGLPVERLSTTQIAMIAGLPKAPSTFNPVVNPSRALTRRGYVLGRMRLLDFISEAEYQVAMSTPDDAKLHGQSLEVVAPYVAEMVRSEMVSRYGDNAYSRGFRVITSVDSAMQAAANAAQREALLAYDSRHGYRGPLAQVELGEEDTEEQWAEVLKPYREVNGLLPVLVLSVEGQSARVYEPRRGIVSIDWDGLSWAAPALPGGRTGKVPKQAADILARGDVIRITERAEKDEWHLVQVPTVEGALVSVSPHDGAIRALVGGFNFSASKFNRITQAERQPGSNFKPFIYSAGLEKGFTPASLINDAPVVFEDRGLEATWRPENYSGRVFGPTRLREALVKSRNLVSIRLLRAMGISHAINYVSRFGFDKSDLPRDLSLALGSGAVTPLEIVTGYAVFANDGFSVKSWFIERIEDPQGEVLYQAAPATVCKYCEITDAERAVQMTFVGPPRRDEQIPVNIAPRVATAQNVYLMRSMMRDVIQRGTARRAQVLQRSDLAGKTGTTNDQHDAWFSGFSSDLATTVWVGFDRPQPLGDRETGGRAALPMWIDYMREALKELPLRPLERPPGLVTVRIDPKSGLLAPAGHPQAIFETFRVENVPAPLDEEAMAPYRQGDDRRAPRSVADDVPEELF
ncbi:Multimodular transpeptidase-transglycosylase [hydrothermal vent metagenome]|uniref:Penicillin-binding protein 1A n=1 Tax=hydrothermal vent metagenome TaxID=652676 RepID=A0A3B1AHN6_9ZZZZ